MTRWSFFAAVLVAVCAFSSKAEAMQDWTLVIHGGAGVMERKQDDARARG